MTGSALQSLDVALPLFLSIRDGVWGGWWWLGWTMSKVGGFFWSLLTGRKLE